MNQKLKTILFYTYITAVVLAVGIILFHLSTAEASGCKHDCETTTNTAVKEDHDHWKQYAKGAIHTCRLHAVYVGFSEGRWWTWCGERAKPAPLLDTSKNDVTPDPQTRILFK